MTIDEAIAHAREVALEQSSIATELSLAVADASKCIKCKQEHEQIAEWLEELKRRREYNDVLSGSVALKNAYRLGYNKAIDDFKKMLTIEKIKEYAESDGFINPNNCGLMIFDIAEQLKECGKNG